MVEISSCITASPTESSGSMMPGLGHHHGIESLRFDLVLGGSRDHIAWRFLLAHRLAPRLVMVLEALLVAAQLLFEMACRLVEARMSFGRRALGLQHQAGGQMQGAVGMETDALLLDRHMGVDGAFEIFLLQLEEPVFDMLAQGLADVEILTRDFDLHGRRKYPCFALVDIHGRVCFERQRAIRMVAVKRAFTPWSRSGRGEGADHPGHAKRAEPSRGDSAKSTALPDLYLEFAAALDGRWNT